MYVHPKIKAKLREKLKILTNRSNGWGYEKRKEKLSNAIRGWINYFRLAEMRNNLKESEVILTYFKHTKYKKEC